MTCTDDDLKRLKELDSAASIHDKYGNEEIRKALPALLARLEAAELCIDDHLARCLWDVNQICSCGYDDKLKAWCKVAGNEKH
jgi:hypothetical protein